MRSGAYDFFRRGYDTLDIARLMNRSEADVLREINQARSARLRKPYPYPPYAQPGEQPRLTERGRVLA